MAIPNNPVAEISTARNERPTNTRLKRALIEPEREHVDRRSERRAAEAP